jgi:hypothetical protein
MNALGVFGAPTAPTTSGAAAAYGYEYDTTPPACALTASGTDASGKKFIQVTVQDAGPTASGLATIVVTDSTNATTVVPPFVPGTKNPVVVTSTKIKQTKPSTLALHVTDVAGNFTDCDPVLTSVLRLPGDQETQTFSGLPASESKVTIANGAPGVNSVTIVVNGVRFKETGLDDGEVRKFNVASAMRAGNANTIEITGRGKAGASADIIISD